MKLREKPRWALLYAGTDIIIPCEKGQEDEIVELVKDWSTYAGADVEITLKKSSGKAKRSLDANAYLWALCGKLGLATGNTKEQEYRKAIKAAGVKTTVLVLDSAVDEIIAHWGSTGVGNFAEVLRKSDKVHGCTIVNVYHGSSSYSTEEMSKLIDYVVKAAEKKKIPTITQTELERLKSQWGQI